MTIQQTIQQREAQAWRGLSSRASIATSSLGTPDEKINVKILLDYIEREKKAISKLIDSLPDDPKG